MVRDKLKDLSNDMHLIKPNFIKKYIDDIVKIIQITQERKSDKMCK